MGVILTFENDQPACLQNWLKSMTQEFLILAGLAVQEVNLGVYIDVHCLAFRLRPVADDLYKNIICPLPEKSKS